MSDTRKAFEKWIKSAPQWFYSCNHLDVDENGQYIFDTTEAAWLGWQARGEHDAKICDEKAKYYLQHGCLITSKSAEDCAKAIREE